MKFQFIEKIKHRGFSLVLVVKPRTVLYTYAYIFVLFKLNQNKPNFPRLEYIEIFWRLSYRLYFVIVIRLYISILNHFVYIYSQVVYLLLSIFCPSFYGKNKLTIIKNSKLHAIRKMHRILSYK